MSGEVVPYRPVIDAVVIDCADPARLAQFWQALLGGELHTQPDGVTELTGGRIRLDFARVPETKQTKNRLHLDLHVPPESKDQAIAHALHLGATPAPDIYDGTLWQTLRDPEGNEFCLIWGGTG
ncbi:VOC family protein [Kribbella turkmenica]|uniref:VOC family protein n=2 Tax=Kribbella turkmenica TaxID=2530375 RepID=A0A4R4X8A1_9ACTN|nr:VOC family protein [Kribbella turkmenica]